MALSGFNWLTHLELLDPFAAEATATAGADDARSQAALAVYEALLSKARIALSRADWLSMEPEELASAIYVKMFHPLERKRLGIIDRVCAADEPDAYVARVVRNAALEEARRHVRQQSRTEVVEDSAETFQNEGMEPLDIEDAAGDLLEALGRLTPSQRNAVLARLAGESTAEIATREARNYGTVASDVSRGLSRLREILSGKQVFVSQALASRIRELAKNSAKTT